MILLQNKLALNFLIFINFLFIKNCISFDNSVFEVKFSKVIYYPDTLADIKSILRKAIDCKKKVAIIGSNKSQGGQTTSEYDTSIRIDLQNFNKLLNLDLQKKEVTVQSGMTWQQLHQKISPHKLSVKSMQSYNDFSIGGSISVNVHGQDIVENPIIKTVKSFKILLSNGEIITASRNQNSELFKLAIGGYGLFGIILEVTLELTDDVLLKNKTVEIETKNLTNYFFDNIINNPKIQFYSARLSIGENDLTDKALIITYQKISNNDDNKFILKFNKLNKLLPLALISLEKFKYLKNLRFGFEKFYESLPVTISRNNFLNATIKNLPQNNESASYILQEYFIPYLNFNKFIDELKSIIKKNEINILNITIRHVNKNNDSFLTYSEQDCCAIVLYINKENSKQDNEKVYNFTNELINKCLSFNGKFYLPYHLLENSIQLNKAYPQFVDFIKLKKKYDPSITFSNKLYEKFNN